MTLPLPSLAVESHPVKALEYQIKQQLNAPQLRIVECYDCTNLTKTSNFNEYCNKLEQKNIIHTFIPVTELQQPLSDILKRGVRVNPRRGLKIRADSIDIDRTKNVFELVHCFVALGNVQNNQSKMQEIRSNEFETTVPTQDMLFENYHSFRVSENNEYYIFDPNQIRTLHIIRTTGCNSLGLEPEFSKICDCCTEKEAVVYCTNCNARCCDECDRKTHSQNNLLESHVRIDMDRALPHMEYCPFHPEKKVEHFCKVCQLPVCSECKMTGSHSKGEMLKHQLVLIKDSYYEALRKSDTDNRNYIRRKAIIDKKLTDCDNRLDVIFENSRTIEDRIMEIAKAAILSLKRQAGEKAIIIRSTQDELTRKKIELENKLEFLKTCKQLNGPVSFIQNMEIFTELANSEMKQDLDLPSDLWVDGDLCVVGDLKIMPRSQTQLPPGVNKRDFDFEEKNYRNTDVQTALSSPTVSTRETSARVTSTETNTQNKAAIEQKRITLTKMAAVRKKKVVQSGLKLDFKPFDGSTILNNEEKQYMLYYCCPFRGLPQTHLLFSTERDGRSIKKMHSIIDGIGITCLLVKVDSQIFGGFAAVRWNNDSKPFGDNSSSFLFQINKNIFIPFKSNYDDSCLLYATPDTLTFGRRDLVIGGNFDRCSSELEYSYSIGLSSEEAKTFLAGSHKFKADEVEIWGFFTNDK